MGAQGGVVQRTCFGHRPDVRAPAFGGALRAAKTHPITPSTLGAHVVARAWAARKSVAAKGGDIQRAVQFEPIVVRAEAFRRARVALLSAWGGSVRYQGGRYARIPFRRPPPDLPLQYPVHVWHVPSRATQLTLRRTRIDSRLCWPC